MTERDKLRDKVRSIYCDGKYMTIQSANQAIADFIIEDRRRIVEPLIKYKSSVGPDIWGDLCNDAIDKSIRLAGVQ